MAILQGEIYFVPFPFSDKPSEIKERTALVISKDDINNDNVILAYVTSVIEKKKYSIEIPLDVQTPVSLVTSEIRTNKIFTASKTIFGRKVCRLNEDFMKGVLEQIKLHLDLSSPYKK